MCRVPVATSAPAFAAPPTADWLDAAPVPPPLSPHADLPPLADEDAGMLDELLGGGGAASEVKPEPGAAAVKAPPPPYSAPSFALAGLYAGYGLLDGAPVTHASAPAFAAAAAAERGGRKAKKSPEEIEAQIERVKKRRRESAQRSRARKSMFVKNLEVENRELKHEVARLRSLVEALAAHHPAAAAAAAQHAAALAAARSAAALMPAPGLVAVDSSWSEPSSSLPTEDGSF